MSEAHQKLLRARTALILKHPFFATLALRLQLREDSTCQTAWTDGEVLAYNPDYISVLSAEKIEGLTAHLVMHPACGHHHRRQGRDPGLWNRACDYAINWLLLDAGFTLPEGYLFLEEYREMSAESVYVRLCDNDELSEKEEGPGDVDEESKKKSENEEGAALPGEVRDAPQESMESELGAEGTNWDEALVSALHTSREMGKIPAGIELLIEQRLYPHLSWEELLSRFIERSARSDYTWMMPNRRYLHQGFYFPGLLDNELAQIAVAVDTSGSIQPEELEQFAAELSAIMEQFPATLHLFYCDCSIQKYVRLERADLPVFIEAQGGGGTDFRPVFSRIEKEGLQPACLVYLTDLQCLHYPQYEPGYPVLWVQTGEEDAGPPFGEVIRMKKNDFN